MVADVKKDTGKGSPLLFFKNSAFNSCRRFIISTGYVSSENMRIIPSSPGKKQLMIKQQHSAS